MSSPLAAIAAAKSSTLSATSAAAGGADASSGLYCGLRIAVNTVLWTNRAPPDDPGEKEHVGIQNRRGERCETSSAGTVAR